MKRAVSLLLAVMLAVFSPSMLQVKAEAAPVSFADLQNTDASTAAAILKWVGYGVIEGDNGVFGVGQNFKRYQMAVFMDRVMGYSQSAVNMFTDLTAGDAYASAILRNVQAGVFDNGGAFRAYDDITREEAFLAMARALDLEFAAYDAAPSSFADDAEISSAARGAIKALVAKGVLEGVQTASGWAIYPKNYISREHMMVMFSNAISAVVNTAGVSSASGQAYPASVVISADGAVLQNAVIGGDLIIAQSVGDGDITLESVQIGGRLVVNGGGSSSIHIRGNSNVSEVVTNKNFGQAVNIDVADDVPVKPAVKAKGNSKIMVTGNVDSLVVPEGCEVVLVNATVREVVVTGERSSVSVRGNSNVTSVAVSGAGTNISVEGNAIVQDAVVNASDANVSLSGTASIGNISLEQPNAVVDLSGSASIGVVNVAAADVQVAVQGGATVATANVTSDNAVFSGNGTVSNVTVADNVAAVEIEVETEVVTAPETVEIISREVIAVVTPTPGPSSSPLPTPGTSTVTPATQAPASEAPAAETPAETPASTPTSTPARTPRPTPTVRPRPTPSPVWNVLTNDVDYKFISDNLGPVTFIIVEVNAAYDSVRFVLNGEITAFNQFDDQYRLAIDGTFNSLVVEAYY